MNELNINAPDDRTLELLRKTELTSEEQAELKDLREIAMNMDEQNTDSDPDSSGNLDTDGSDFILKDENTTPR